MRRDGTKETCRPRFAKGGIDPILDSQPSSKETLLDRPKRPYGRNPYKKMRNDEIKLEFVDGKNVGYLSMKYELCRGAIYRICKGVERKKVPERRVDPERETRDLRIKEEFAAGTSLRNLATKYGITCQRISQICKGVERKKVPKRNPDPKLQRRNDEIRREYVLRESAKELAVKYGLAKCTIHMICKEMRDNKAMREKRNAKMREEYANRDGNETVKMLAERWEVSESTAYRICKGVTRIGREFAAIRTDPILLS